MARIFTSGAEEYDPLALWGFIDGRGFGDPYVSIAFKGDFESNITNRPRTGRGCYLLDNETNLNLYFDIEKYPELFIGVAINFSSLSIAGDFLRLYTDDPGVYGTNSNLSLNADGSISAKRGGTELSRSAAGIIATNAWHYIEVWFKPLNADGRFVVKVDGAQVIDYTGDTTDEEVWINGFQLRGLDRASKTYLFDDIVINDATGSYNNSFPGQVRLLPIRPSSAGTYAEWTRAGVDLGSDQAQAINGAFDFTMLQTPDADKKISFKPDVPDLPSGAVIKNIVLTAKGKVENGTGVLAPLIKSGVTEDVSADQTLAGAWRHYQHVWPTNPADGTAWEETDLGNLEIGVSS